MGRILKEAIIGNVPFWVLTITSIMLIVAAFLLPPTAAIDGSVIGAVGELLGFGALWTIIKAMDKGLDAKVKHNGTEVMIGDISEPEPRYPEFDRPSPKAEDYE